MRASIVIILVFAACGGGQETQEGSYSDVQALFARSCAGSTCHIDVASQPASGLDLSAGRECASLIDVAAVEAPERVLVVPGASGASYLLCKLVPECADRPPGASIMPLGVAGGLDRAELDLVAGWIDDGAPGCGGSDLLTPRFAGATSATPLPSAIRLEWSAASDDATPAAEIVYLVYEAAESGGQDFAQPTLESLPGASSITVGGLPVSTQRFYVVRARDRAGNIDDNTVEVSATTPAVGDEAAPTFAGVRSVAPVGSSSVRVAWQAASDDVSPPEAIGYRVYVADAAGGQDFAAPNGESAPGELDLLVSGLTPATEYHVVTRAVDQAGNEDENTVEATVTTNAGTSFSAQIEPILIAACTGMACHAGARPAQALDLSAGAAYGELVGVASQQCAGRTLVVPSQPGASYLMNKLRGIDMCFGSRMPKGGAALSQDSIQLFEDWIREGALDN